MSHQLTIDIGNTRIKYALFNGKETKPAFVGVSDNTEDAINEIEKILNRHSVDGAIVCSVAQSTYPFLDFLEGKVKHLFDLRPGLSTPLINAYGSPESLGMDRLALACGAYALHPDENNLVIAAGTCITYNLQFANKYFRGGAKSPGINMRLKALNEFTERLPLVKAQGDVPVVGYDTESSIRSGVITGSALEIDGFIANYEKQFGRFNVILTGGDAALLGSHLKSQIFAAPDILMTGLNNILLYNVPLF